MTDSPAPHADHEPEDDRLAFTPVFTGSTRHDGWTADRQRAFIDQLGRTGGIAASARAVGMMPKSAYRLRTRADAAGFAAAWDIALAMGRDRALATAIARGRDGYTVPVRWRGRVMGRRHRFDNRLLYAACYGQPMLRDPY